jgi:hypothetical protein
MDSNILPAPPATISKKKRSSEKFKESYNKSAFNSASKKARPSEKALVPVPTLSSLVLHIPARFMKMRIKLPLKPKIGITLINGIISCDESRSR